MKKILFCAVLTAATPSSIIAQNAPNREGLGEAPRSAPADADGASPGASEKAKSNTDGKASDKTPDEHFMRKAGKAGKMEVKIAEMGVSKASREDLKSFSAMLVKDHSAANMELAAIAKKEGVEIPDPHSGKDHEKGGHGAAQSDASGRKNAAAPAEDSKKAAEAAKHKALEQKTGAEFDTVYMEVMEECHAKDIALFEKAEGEVKSEELKGFITKTLPVLKKHADALMAISKNPSGRPDAKTGSAPAAGR